MEENYISEMIINNFRNYSNKKIEFFKSFNIIIGNNGVGKTNILEALSIFSNSKGLRGAGFDEMRNIVGNSPFLPPDILFSVFLKTANGNKISISQKIDKKIIKFNDEVLKTSAYLNDILKITWLTPQMDGFFINSSADRRRFIDKTAELLYKNHYDNVKKYEFFIKERMKILTTQTIQDKWIDIVEKKIAELGVAIASIRNIVVDYLNAIFDNYTTKFPTGFISIIGEIEALMKEKKSIEVENYYRIILAKNRVDDIKSKRTLFGVHKSDISIFNKEKNIKANLCSTGEQKILLISLIVVRVIFTKRLNSGVPILLLDEICSHIDNNIRQNLFYELKRLNVQTFLTGINKDDFIGLGNNFIEL